MIVGKYFQKYTVASRKEKVFEIMQNIRNDINYSYEKVEEFYNFLETKVTVLKRIYYKEGSAAREIKNT
jgi:hypothetical protein